MSDISEMLSFQHGICRKLLMKYFALFKTKTLKFGMLSILTARLHAGLPGSCPSDPWYCWFLTGQWSSSVRLYTVHDMVSWAMWRFILKENIFSGVSHCGKILDLFNFILIIMLNTCTHESSDIFPKLIAHIYFKIYTDVFS